MEPPEQQSSLPATVSQPYLVFSVGPERYALPLAQVVSVQPESPITRVPGARPSLRGVMNLRGKLLAVVDLPQILGVKADQAGSGHVVVVHHAEVEAGLLVDQAEEILELDWASTEPTLSTLSSERAEFLKAQVRSGEHVVGLLQLDRVLEAARHD